MTLQNITLELARDHDFPNGSPEHGYRFTAPLDEKGHIDPDAWHKERDHCRVVRFWDQEPEMVGHLIRKPGGSWAFHYDIHGDEDDDEAGYRFGAESFHPGEYVSIKDHEGDMRTFKVITVRDVNPN